MSEPLRAVIVSHAGIASALIDAVKGIAGDASGIVAITNTGASPDRLCSDIGAAVGSGPAVVFVDMPGGSCLHAALAELRARSDVAVVAGVNLPMLLDFAFHRELPPFEAAERAVAAGTRAIRSVTLSAG
ncbi:MAG: hypothetical protein OEO20_11950 [Gemmatimonadota bacterium]|nr:hypothetical protein [Gemmatimonadota bacterium]MDH3367263.1 hypothetical protein [Gemmatimonadota bacterium]MDH3479008.1 hypothetical protein [Gemmatimonadota bacterium]MDH3571616.1 hypothetical protein [Gemmatimonadota bacterium]MDH5549836.1 hypothetical protein [Gemmatimonadota bacterium]